MRYDPLQGAPCPQASAAGLECATLQGSWAQLLQLQRPAVLALTDGSGRAHQVLLVQVAQGQARLALGAAEGGQGVAVHELLASWSGQALLLCRPAFQPVRSISYGMKGPEVRSLRELLQQARGARSRQPVGDTFDGAMLREVQAFQREHRLATDGIIGTRTQMVLDAVADTQGVPVLRPGEVD